MPEATVVQTAGYTDHTAAAAMSCGEIVQASEGQAGYVQALAGLAAAEVGSLRTGEIIVDVDCAAATTFAIGELVVFDASANLAVNLGAAHDGANDFILGTCVKTCTSSDTKVRVWLNKLMIHNLLRPFVFEFDCQGGDTDSHVLIPAEQNRHGLIIVAIFGVVTEVFAGGTEDQGVVTVSDESDNSLATLTASDAGADALNDVIEGFFLHEKSTGDAGLVVAAGEFVDAAVTQQTSGTSAAGKMKVYVIAIPAL